MREHIDAIFRWIHTHGYLSFYEGEWTKEKFLVSVDVEGKKTTEWGTPRTAGWVIIRGWENGQIDVHVFDRNQKEPAAELSEDNPGDLYEGILHEAEKHLDFDG